VLSEDREGVRPGAWKVACGMLLLGYGALGVLAGLLAGLLGVGGGVVIVPGLLLLFAAGGLDNSAMHLALGTSLASICFTSLSSVQAHHRRGSVDWTIFRAVTPAVLVGSFGGTFLAALVPTLWLKLLFGFYLAFVSLHLLRTSAQQERPVSGEGKYLLPGLGIGVLSALVGIGGGSLSVPLMLWRGVAVRRAVGTSAAIGFPIALAGAAGYVINGLGKGGLPTPHLGYVYLPALLGLVVPSVVMAPLGAKLAHRLPVLALKRAFAVFLLLVAGKLLWSTLANLW
jgi:uncharacterized membrane protein YfcA